MHVHSSTGTMECASADQLCLISAFDALTTKHNVTWTHNHFLRSQLIKVWVPWCMEGWAVISPAHWECKFFSPRKSYDSWNPGTAIPIFLKIALRPAETRLPHSEGFPSDKWGRKRSIRERSMQEIRRTGLASQRLGLETHYGLPGGPCFNLLIASHLIE